MARSGSPGNTEAQISYGSAEAFRFSYDVVYTNVMSAGAYRGYGATQGIFALESAVNELAQTLHMDPTVLRAKNMVREGQMMPAYYGAGDIGDHCLHVRPYHFFQDNGPDKVG